MACQYCGELGKQDSRQVAVSRSVANEQASRPVACRLYLPQAWADDPVRRHKAGVPEEIAFRTKPQIALAQSKLHWGRVCRWHADPASAPFP